MNWVSPPAKIGVLPPEQMMDAFLPAPHALVLFFSFRNIHEAFFGHRLLQLAGISLFIENNAISFLAHCVPGTFSTTLQAMEGCHFFFRGAMRGLSGRLFREVLLFHPWIDRYWRYFSPLFRTQKREGERRMHVFSFSFFPMETLFQERRAVLRNLSATYISLF